MTAAMMDRASFLLGYLTARLDCAPDILDMVAQAEEYLNGEAVPLPALAAMDPLSAQEKPDEPPAPERLNQAPPKPNQSHQPKPGTKRHRVVELTKEGLTAREIAKRLNSSIGSISVMRADARKRGELPRPPKPGLPPSRDVTAELLGDPDMGGSEI